MKYAALIVILALTGCGRKNNVATPVVAPPTTIGQWKIEYIGDLELNSNGAMTREIIVVTDTETGVKRLMIRGFGVSDEYRVGKVIQHD